MANISINLSNAGIPTVTANDPATAVIGTAVLYSGIVAGGVVVGNCTTAIIKIIAGAAAGAVKGGIEAGKAYFEEKKAEADTAKTTEKKEEQPEVVNPDGTTAQ